jgi:hypothetical protein
MSKYVNDSIIVFNLKVTESGNPLVGNTMLRFNKRKHARLYGCKCRACMELGKCSAAIVGRWTNWVLNAGNIERIHPGIYMHMLENLCNNHVHIFRNESCFYRADAAGKLNHSCENDLYLFEKDATWTNELLVA